MNFFQNKIKILICIFLLNCMYPITTKAKERILFLANQLKKTEYFAIHQNTRVLVGLKNLTEIKGKLTFINDSILQVKGVTFKASDINFICVKKYDKSFKIVSEICYLISGVGVITEVWLGKLEDSTSDPQKIDTYQKIGGCVAIPLCGCGLLGLSTGISNELFRNSKNFDLRTSFKATVIPLKQKSKYVNELYNTSQKTSN